MEKQSKEYFIHQRLYTRRQKDLPVYCRFGLLRARKHETASTTHTRPDLCVAVAFISCITKLTIGKKTIKLANATIWKAKNGRVKGLRHHNLDKDSLRMLAYSDSNFANHDDLSIQLG